MAKTTKKIVEEEVVENQEMDWDSGLSIEDEARAINLPEVGEYDFTVEELERTFSQKSGNPMARVNLRLDCDGQPYRVYDYLVLSTSMAWKLCQFFESLGLKEKGKDLKKMPWDKVLGATGRVKIKHEEYNGEPRVKVDRYLLTVAAAAPKSPKSLEDTPSLPFEL